MTNKALGMPPLLVRASAGDRPGEDVLLAPWLPLATPLEGRLWCDVSTPSGATFGNHVDFGAGCGPEQAVETILQLWQGSPSPVAAWLDGEWPSEPSSLAPLSSMTKDAWGKPVPQAALTEIPAGEGRMFRVTGEPGAMLLLDDLASTEEPRTLVARDGDIACCRRDVGSDPEWTVLPDLGPVGTYWRFSDHNGLAAMRAVALHLVDTHGKGDVPEDELVVMAHAAVVLRYLGPGYRERVRAILDRSGSGSLDVVGLRWCLMHDDPRRNGYDEATLRLAEMCRSRYPRFTGTFECLSQRLWPALSWQRETGGPLEEALSTASEAMGALGSRALGDHATLVLGSGM